MGRGGEGNGEGRRGEWGGEERGMGRGGEGNGEGRRGEWGGGGEGNGEGRGEERGGRIREKGNTMNSMQYIQSYSIYEITNAGWKDK